MSYSHYITTTMMTMRRMDTGESTSNRDLRRIVVSSHCTFFFLFFFFSSINIFLQVDFILLPEHYQYHPCNTSKHNKHPHNMSKHDYHPSTHQNVSAPISMVRRLKAGMGRARGGEDQRRYMLEMQYLRLKPFGMRHHTHSWFILARLSIFLVTFSHFRLYSLFSIFAFYSFSFRFFGSLHRQFSRPRFILSQLRIISRLG